MEIKQVQKYVITSPKKIREVVPMIKKLTPYEAYERLPFSGKRAGRILRKVIGTAIANAKQKGVSEKNLFFKEIQITDGPILRRWRAGARGMAKPYKKRMSHIRIVLGVREEEKAVSSKKTSKKKSGVEKAKDTKKKRGIGSLVKINKKRKIKKSVKKKSKGTKKKSRKEKKA
jgi:large subunit ribosomal protein L22